MIYLKALSLNMETLPPDVTVAREGRAGSHRWEEG